MATCWAMSPKGNRCSKAAGKHTVHVSREEWGDEESLDLGKMIVQPADPPKALRKGVVTIHDAVPAFNHLGGGLEDDEDSALDTGSCFSCGCSAAAHQSEDGSGCRSHSCRTYVP